MQRADNWETYELLVQFWMDFFTNMGSSINIKNTLSVSSFNTYRLFFFLVSCHLHQSVFLSFLFFYLFRSDREIFHH